MVVPCGGASCMWADWGGWEVPVMVVPCGVGCLCVWADWGGWEVTVMVVPCGGGASLYVGRLGRVGGDSDGCPMWGWGFSVCGQTGEGGR